MMEVMSPILTRIRDIFLFPPHLAYCNSFLVLPTLQIKGSVLHKPLFHMSVTLSGSPGHPHFWRTGYNFRGSHELVRFDHSLGWLTELRKVHYLQVQIYYKGYRGPAKDDTGGAKWGRVPNAELLCLLLTESAHYPSVIATCLPIQKLH